MHRNTYLLVTVLAVFAALVVGVNLGRKTGTPASPGVSLGTSATPEPSLSPTPVTAKLVSYQNDYCGIALSYPAAFTKLESATGSAVFINPQNTKEGVALICQEYVPRPPLSAENIEAVTMWNSTQTASVAARLYHDASSKDGTPLDSFIFTHPTTGLDVLLAGFGPTFQQILASLTFLQ